MKILHLEPLRYDNEARSLLEDVATVTYDKALTQEELLSVAASRTFDAIFTRLGIRLDASVFDVVPHLRWIVTPTTGLDHIDIEEAIRRNISVISLRGETAFLETIRSTAEHTWALVLSLARKVPAAHHDVTAGHWRREPFLAEELYGRTLGIIGCGRLGRMVAGYGVAFGMRVIAFDSDPNVIGLSADGIEFVSLEELLKESDVVSLHLPLNSTTSGFLSQDLLLRMKNGVLLINTARGELLDEKGLLSQLQSGRIAGAALDVLTGDGSWNGISPKFHPFVDYAGKNANLILTPHIGGYGKSSLHNTRMFITKKFINAVTKSVQPI